MIDRITCLWLCVSLCICCCYYCCLLLYFLVLFSCFSICIFFVCFCQCRCFFVFWFFPGYFTEYLCNWSSRVKWIIYDTNELAENLNYKGLRQSGWIWFGGYFSLSLSLSGSHLVYHYSFNFYLRILRILLIQPT